MLKRHEDAYGHEPGGAAPLDSEGPVYVAIIEKEECKAEVCYNCHAR